MRSFEPLTLRLTSIAPSMLSLLAGCGASYNPQIQRTAVQRRIADNEFARCPANKVKIEHLHEDYWRATGCGKSVVFDVGGSYRDGDDCRAEPDLGK